MFLNRTTLPLLVFVMSIAGCGGGGGGNSGTVDVSSSSASSSSSSSSSSASSSGGEPATSSELIKINQTGYMSVGEKFAIVPAVSATQFELKSAADDSIVLTADLSATMQWTPSGDDRFKQADFSGFTTPGEYFVSVDGVADSNPFLIGDDVYADLHDAVLKAYYFNRASTALEATHAGDWARSAGHPDTNVWIHDSAATESRPAGTAISSPKGWYDAGDYGKYTVNSGISVYTLLAAYEHFSEFYASRDMNIPESGDDVPDILDEVKWNLDWLATMQDEDGGVYHKIGTLNWAGEFEMPDEDTRQRYAIGKGTAATLDFAAMLAQASRIYAAFETEFPGVSATWLSQAEDAWDWAMANPNVAYSGNDSGSGAYGDSSFGDEFAWAAAELYLATEDAAYLTEFNNQNAAVTNPWWGGVATLGYMSLVASGESLMESDDYSSVRSDLIGSADAYLADYQASAYLVPMVNNDFVWGSNSQGGNKAVVLLQAYRETGNAAYRDAALGMLSYLLGRNPTDYSYVSGYGHKTPMDLHHRQSRADGVVAPVPGFLAGGPHNGWQDTCTYPSSDNAKSYMDAWCSYSTNEVTINWNAPLLYLLAAFLSE